MRTTAWVPTRPRGQFLSLLLAAGLLTQVVCSPSSAATRVLHHFGDTPTDGSGPNGSLTISGATLYGLTAGGGEVNGGTVFKVQTDGTGYSILRRLGDDPGGAMDGTSPYGSLTLSGSSLFGLTSLGGSGGGGTVFRLGTDATGFTVLHSFAGGAADGAFPRLASLTLSGSKLYGLTGGGGAQDVGTLFSLNTNGTGFSLLHSFAGGAGDGATPLGSLTLANNQLYGMTQQGGSSENGTLFRVNQDGSGYSLLHQFTSGSADGGEPAGSLLAIGGKLYGMSIAGGSQNTGALFSLNTDGTNFRVLHSFTGGPSDGAYPYGSLTAAGAKLYGLTSGGGGSDLGTLFTLNADGTGFQLLQSFTGETNNGRLPLGDVTLSANGAALFGLTYGGGSDDSGTIFTLGIPEPSAACLTLLGLATLAAFAARASAERLHHPVAQVAEEKQLRTASGM